MKPGTLFMAASWAVILVLFIYSVVRTLTEKDEAESPDPPDRAA